MQRQRDLAELELHDEAVVDNRRGQHDEASQCPLADGEAEAHRGLIGHDTAGPPPLYTGIAHFVLRHGRLPVLAGG